MTKTEITKHVLTLTNEEKNTLNKAANILQEIAQNDNDENLWWNISEICDGCEDFYDISHFLSFLGNDENELIV